MLKNSDAEIKIVYKCYSCEYQYAACLSKYCPKCGDPRLIEENKIIIEMKVPLIEFKCEVKVGEIDNGNDTSN